VQVVAEELCRVLSPVPFLGSTLVVRALLESRDDETCARLLPRLAEGAVGALVWCGAEGWSTDRVACSTLDGYTVDGHSPYVLDGDSAEVLLVVAETGAELGLFEVVTQEGVRRRHSWTMDETRRLAEVQLIGASARRVGIGNFRAGLRRMRDAGCAVLAAEQAGAAAARPGDHGRVHQAATTIRPGHRRVSSTEASDGRYVRAGGDGSIRCLCRGAIRN
jgi:alkylation response protein AidB-like acyl-CoA dehydrogenase